MLMQIPTPTASELMELVGTTRPPWIVFALKESIPSIEDHLASRRGFTRIELDGAAMRNLDTYWHELMNSKLGSDTTRVNWGQTPFKMVG